MRISDFRSTRIPTQMDLSEDERAKLVDAYQTREIEHKKRLYDVANRVGALRSEALRITGEIVKPEIEQQLSKLAAEKRLKLQEKLRQAAPKGIDLAELQQERGAMAREMQAFIRDAKIDIDKLNKVNRDVRHKIEQHYRLLGPRFKPWKGIPRSELERLLVAIKEKRTFKPSYAFPFVGGDRYSRHGGVAERYFDFAYVDDLGRIEATQTVSDHVSGQWFPPVTPLVRIFDLDEAYDYIFWTVTVRMPVSGTVALWVEAVPRSNGFRLDRFEDLVGWSGIEIDNSFGIQAEFVGTDRVGETDSTPELAAQLGAVTYTDELALFDGDSQLVVTGVLQEVLEPGRAMDPIVLSSPDIFARGSLVNIHFGQYIKSKNGAVGYNYTLRTVANFDYPSVTVEFREV